MDFKVLHEIQTPDSWISEAIAHPRSKPHRPVYRKAIMAAALCLALVLAMGTAAAVSSDFRSWLLGRFGEEAISANVTRLALPQNLLEIQDGFLAVGEEGGEITVYTLDGIDLSPCEPVSLEGTLTYQGEPYPYSLQYVRRGSQVYAWDCQGGALKLSGYDEDTGILWLEAGNLRNSYYLDYATSTLTPVIDPSQFSQLLSQTYLWDDGGVMREGYVKLADEVQVSRDGSYLLFGSNVDCLTDFAGQYQPDAREWFVQDVKTGEVTKLPDEIPGNLHVDEIGFLDGSHISIGLLEDGQPAVYDCQTGELTPLGGMPGADFGNTLIYDIGVQDGQNRFQDLLTGTIYELPAGSSGITGVSKDRRLIYQLSETASQIYLTDTHTLLTVEETFSDLSQLDGVVSLGEGRYLFLGIQNDIETGWLVEITGS